jgi:predicted nicotinamide N-methyase
MHESQSRGSAGQILWPAATLLAGYLAANPRWATGCSCALELGAGLGLVGCVAARLCPALLTDHNADVLSVLRRNAALNSHQHGVSCDAGLLLSTGPLLYTRTWNRALCAMVTWERPRIP